MNDIATRPLDTKPADSEDDHAGTVGPVISKEGKIEEPPMEKKNTELETTDADVTDSSTVLPASNDGSMTPPNVPVRTHHENWFSLVTEPSVIDQMVSWDDDEEVKNCVRCNKPFTLIFRRHHCRNCGHVVCGMCSVHVHKFPGRFNDMPQRICDKCFLEVKT